MNANTTKPRNPHPETASPVTDLDLEAQIVLAEQTVIARDAREPHAEAGQEGRGAAAGQYLLDRPGRLVDDDEREVAPAGGVTGRAQLGRHLADRALPASPRA